MKNILVTSLIILTLGIYVTMALLLMAIGGWFFLNWLLEYPLINVIASTAGGLLFAIWYTKYRDKEELKNKTEEFNFIEKEYTLLLFELLKEISDVYQIFFPTKHYCFIKKGLDNEIFSSKSPQNKVLKFESNYIDFFENYIFMLDSIREISIKKEILQLKKNIIVVKKYLKYINNCIEYNNEKHLMNFVSILILEIEHILKNSKYIDNIGIHLVNPKERYTKTLFQAYKIWENNKQSKELENWIQAEQNVITEIVKNLNNQSPLSS